MLFGHQHNDDVSGPVPEPTTAAAPDLNPLAVDPTTGVSLPVPTEAEALATPQSTIVQPTTDNPLNPGPATPPPPPPVPTSAPTVDTPSEEALPAQAAPEPESTPPAIASEEAPASQPAATEEPTMPFDDTKRQSGGYRSDSVQTGIDENDPKAVLADFLAGDGPNAPKGKGPITFDQTKLSTKGKEVLASLLPYELMNLKQQALAQLTPLVDKLDQTPEERFRTKMMMLQSTDNPELLKDAYQAAQQIEDEKARAQALLDVINEINYFNSLNNQQSS